MPDGKGVGCVRSGIPKGEKNITRNGIPDLPRTTHLPSGMTVWLKYGASKYPKILSENNLKVCCHAGRSPPHPLAQIIDVRKVVITMPGVVVDQLA